MSKLKEKTQNQWVQRFLNSRFWFAVWQNKHNLFCFVIIVIFILISLLGAVDFLPDFQARVGTSYEAPSFSFAKIMGTDVFGRSVFYKVLSGANTAISMGFLVCAITIPIGILLGALSGYFGGKIDHLIIWFYSVVASVPGILLIIAISYLLGKGFLALCIAMAFTFWVGLCRMIRGEFLKHKEREYVLAAKLLGLHDLVIIFRHILPNVYHVAIVTASLVILNAIKSEVLLTYIGVGIQDGASWGSMIADAPGELVNGIWWPLCGVVVAMFLIIYALNVLGDLLRDTLDPKIVSQNSNEKF